MFIATSTAFGFSLDLMCLFFIFAVTFSFLIAGQERLGDQVGLAITQAMALTGMMQWGIRQSAEVANQMMAVERVLEYKSLSPETEPKVPREVPKLWPEKGVIKFDDMTLTYIEGEEPVLKHLEIEIKENEKVGIVGRTGAGKSSLIAAIFRLARVEGSILIDGIDTATIPLHILRSKVSIIPQDPVLFSGTLRRNLDPFEEYSDAAVWQALHEVELGELGGSALGLQASVMAGGTNFSVGQRQLLCLARAILRENKILVLDEATANVDPQTDTLIQRTIRSRFANCTVLTVAHRLHTIMDSDRVLVMDAGQAAEFASPTELINAKDGIFRSMIEQSGRQEAEQLIALAKKASESKVPSSSLETMI
uniref:Putative peptide exporter abc superfamily protein n=1 Tax=Xenopsylla cheopis TaxID=163159 RepID=A0A6M2DYD7_XENCH